MSTSQAYAASQYSPYPPYPGPLSLSVGPGANPSGYNPMQPEQPSASSGQAASPGPVLVQLGATHNFLVNNRPARYIQVLDVDPSYQRARTPSPRRSPGKNDPIQPNPTPSTKPSSWSTEHGH